MYPIPPSEHLIETKICKHCGSSFPITDKDMEFYEKVSPTFRGKKYAIPTPTLCPDCRQQRRLSFRNERKLYKRKCDATGKDIISMHQPNKSIKVYDYSAWWGDTWEPTTYGRDFDFNRPFFDQFADMMNDVPWINMSRMESENSEYCNQAGNLSDCYLCFNADFSQKCLYSESIQHSLGCIDCSRTKNCEQCSYCVDCEHCFDCKRNIHCIDCSRSEDMFDCVGCENCHFCFDCHNQSGKSYYAHDEYVGEERYFELLESYKSIFDSSKMNENVTESVNIVNSRNTSLSSNCVNIQNCKYCSNITDTQDAYDVDYFGIGIELAYECPTVGAGFSRSAFCENIGGNVSDIFYCFSCMNNTSHLFGCIGLRNKSYCILNKQYTKEEYEELVPKIIEHMMKTGEWGEFFPSSLSPFGYNETVAQEYFPLTRDAVIATKEVIQVSETLDHHTSFHSVRDDGTEKHGETFLHGPVFNWSDYEAPFPKVEKIIPASKLPDDISKIPDDILNWAIECEVTKKPFRIIRQELEFYRKHNLPIPRRHPDQRHLDRMAQRNPRKLFERKCDKCGKDMITTYAPFEAKQRLEVPLGCAPDRPEIVYCEECYGREVMG